MARRVTLIVVCLLLASIAYALVGSSMVNVDCKEPVFSSVSPEGTDSLSVCRRPMLIAMPGQSSDAPGWLVMRDKRAYITGIIDLSMVQNASEPEWSADRVDMKLTASFQRTSDGTWLSDRLWRLRAVLGLVPSDESFR